jgi:hypothetical protein
MIGWTVVALLVALLPPIQASAECERLPLRTFTPEERERFQTQYGQNWWQALGLIPGPSTPNDWVERPFGDSFATVFSPQQFWDPRGCGVTIDRPARPESEPATPLPHQ